MPPAETLRAALQMALLACPIIILATAGLVAQDAHPSRWQDASRAPARDPGAPRAGTAGVSGRVTAAADGTPLAHAIVDLMCAGMTAGPLSVEADDDGRFEFRALAPGACHLTARRRGYVAAPAGREVTLTQASVAHVDIALEQSGVITGRVVDELGEPMSHVMVSAVRRTRAGPDAMVQGRDTDDEGRFRLFDLIPGTYVVRAEPMQGRRMTAGTESSLAYAPAFAPGVPDAGSAQVIAIGRSREVSGVEIRLTRQRTYRISGAVVESNGRAPRGALLTVSHEDGMGGRSGQGHEIGAGGRFVVEGLAPGEYMLEVGYRETQPARDVEYARQDITINGDIDDLIIVTTPTATVNGELVVEGAPLRKSLPADLQVTAVPGDPRAGVAWTTGPPVGQVDDQRRFTLRGVAGPVVLRPMVNVDGWWLDRVMYRGEDVTDVPTELRSSAPGQIDLLMVFTSRASRVTGRVSDGSGRPVAGSRVLAFAEPRRAGVLQRAGDRFATADERGAFVLEGLTAERYLLAAVRPHDWSEDMYERCAGSATPITLLSGESSVVNLDVIAAAER